MRKIAIPIFCAIAIILSGCIAKDKPVGTVEDQTHSQEGAPPAEILYLGGAKILNEFRVTGGPNSNTADNEIIIAVPLSLVNDGFYAAVIGTTDDGASDNLLKGVRLDPGQYYVITKEEYQQYKTLHLIIEYSWGGTLMSMRAIDLYTLEDITPVFQ